MFIRKIGALIFLLLLTSLTLAQSSTLRELADARGFYIGAAVQPQFIENNPQYGETLAREFNMLVAENQMKFCNIQPEPGVYEFEEADELMAFAEEHDMAVRGHTLIWHQCVPQWARIARYTREEAMEVLQEYITTVVGRYKGKIVAWDVVNEGIVARDTLRSNVWKQRIGEDYVEMAFRWAHETDPDALLFYNDYGAEDINPKSDAIYEMVKAWVEKGVPIHGVGLQMHTSIGQPPDLDELRENIRRLGDLGLQVHITEMDVALYGVTDEEHLAEQAQVYRDVIGVCLEEEACTALLTWGFTDAHSWLRSNNDREAPLLFDANYQPKPAYFTFVEMLEE
jgi:endo-1,4-beta-xylanase